MSVLFLCGIPLSLSTLAGRTEVGGDTCPMQLEAHGFPELTGLGTELGASWIPQHKAGSTTASVSHHWGRTWSLMGLEGDLGLRLAGWAEVCQVNGGQETWVQAQGAEWPPEF